MSSTIEEQLASLTKAIEGLTKCAHEQDAKLSKLTNKMDILQIPVYQNNSTLHAFSAVLPADLLAYKYMDNMLVLLACIQP